LKISCAIDQVKFMAAGLWLNPYDGIQAKATRPKLCVPDS